MKVYGFTISFVAWKFTQIPLKIEKCFRDKPVLEMWPEFYFVRHKSLFLDTIFYLCFPRELAENEVPWVGRIFNAKTLFACESKMPYSSIALVILRPIVRLHLNYTCIKHSLKSINYQLSRTFVCFKSRGSLEYIGASLEVKWTRCAAGY